MRRASPESYWGAADALRASCPQTARGAGLRTVHVAREFVSGWSMALAAYLMGGGPKPFSPAGCWSGIVGCCVAFAMRGPVFRRVA
jgi:hypothetical protein